MNAAWVAEARRVYVPMVRWMRANGFDIHHYSGSFGSTLVADSNTWSIGLDEVVVRSGAVCGRLTINTGALPEQRICPTSITRGINHLVDAGVLPDEFHSLNATGSYYDPAGTRAYLHGAPALCRCANPGCDGRPGSPCQVKAVGGAA